MINQGLKYNFVFFFANYDYWKAILGKELYNSPNVRIYKGAFEGNSILQKLFKIHWSYKINRRIRLPFKRIWFNKMYTQHFNNNLPLCFVYMGGNYIYADGGFTKYVRKKDKRNKQIILHNDLITKKCDYDYSIIRNKVDLATTYDISEAKRFNIHYFREDTYSRIIDLPDHVDFDTDVYFLGAAKDRLKEIIGTYKVLANSGLKCKFLIAGVKKEDQFQAPGIEFITGISYEENIKNVLKSRCILEIIQKGSVDITTRALEAIAYQRKLLTNCQTIPNEYFNQRQLQVFVLPDEIDTSFIKEEYNQADFLPLLDMNPMRRLYDIQEQLEKQNNDKP